LRNFGTKAEFSHNNDRSLFHSNNRLHSKYKTDATAEGATIR
jgi:hypothetical protein